MERSGRGCELCGPADGAGGGHFERSGVRNAPAVTIERRSALRGRDLRADELRKDVYRVPAPRAAAGAGAAEIRPG